MRFARTIPPAASPLSLGNIGTGVQGLLAGGKATQRLESELKDYFGVKHCFLVSSGKAALTIILQALHAIFPEKDEVLIPAFTCFSVPSAIKHAGLRVRLCDMGPNSLDFDFAQLTDIIKRAPGDKSRILCVVPTHLFGVPADIKRLRELSNGVDLVVVEDAAQAMGGEWHGQKLGALGDVNFLSLGRGKSLSAVEGGIILTNRDDIGEAIRAQIAPIAPYGPIAIVKLVIMSLILKTFLHPSLFWFPNLLPFVKLGETIYEPVFPVQKMSAFQAGLLHGWQKKLHGLQVVRKEKVRRYVAVLQGNLLAGTKDNALPDLIRFPFCIENSATRAVILGQSVREGLGIMASYPTPVNEIEELQGDFAGQSFPVAKKLSDQLVTLPIHPYVAEQDQRNIIALLMDNTA